MDEPENISKVQFRYQLPDKHKENIVFLELCQNSNISKCIYQPDRKYQVQQNQKMIEKLWHFFDAPSENIADGQVIAFRFRYPHFQKYIYHNFGVLDEKFIYWIDQIMSRQEQQREKKTICYWNAVSHRVSNNSLSDI